MNRKLIRPNLSEIKDKMGRETAKKKTHPSYDTFAENYYYLKQMNKKVLMSIVFQDGEKVEGQIEWYDRNCIKINRKKEPNLLIYKRDIKYIYKMENKENPEEKKKKPVKNKKSE